MAQLSALVYGVVDLNLIDGSAIWVQSAVQALAPFEASSGSMKWFMPPTPMRVSRMQAETHEPSTVPICSPTAVT